MCSEIDERTRDNPEAAMLHSNALCQGYMQGLSQNPSPLEVAQAYDAHQQRMAQQYPGAWPWPVSGIAKGDIQRGDPVTFTEGQWASLDKPKPEPQHFDSEAHRSFMKSLG